MNKTNITDGGVNLEENIFKQDVHNVINKLETLLYGVINEEGKFDGEEALNYAKWALQKATLKYIDNNTEHNFPIIYKCVYWVHLGVNIGSEEDKHRPVTIVRSERNSSICYIVPLSSQKLNDNYWYHIDLENFNSSALVDQFRVISKDRIDRPYARSKGKIVSILDSEMEEIQKQIRRMFGTPKN